LRPALAEIGLVRDRAVFGYRVFSEIVLFGYKFNSDIRLGGYRLVRIEQCVCSVYTVYIVWYTAFTVHTVHTAFTVGIFWGLKSWCSETDLFYGNELGLPRDDYKTI